MSVAGHVVAFIDARVVEAVTVKLSSPPASLL